MTKSYYDNIANEYNSYGEEAITDWQLGYLNVLNILGNISNKKILDYGAGTGKFSRVLKDKNAEVVGIDISAKELEIARKNNPDIKFKLVKESLNLFDQSFDFVVLNFVLCAVSSKKEIEKILDNAFNALHVGGSVIILNSNVEKSSGREFITFAIEDIKEKTSGKDIKIFLGKNRSLTVDDYYWTLSDYKNILENKGFNIKSINEPLADNDNYSWLDEKNSPPFLIIEAKKD